jgi:hypothetical protein
MNTQDNSGNEFNGSFYRDLEREHNCTFTTDGNLLLNEDRQC